MFREGERIPGGGLPDIPGTDWLRPHEGQVLPAVPSTQGALGALRTRVPAPWWLLSGWEAGKGQAT